MDDLPPDSAIDFTGQHPSDAVAVLHTFLRYLPLPITGYGFPTAVVKLCWETSADIFTSFSIARLLLQMLPPICFHGVVYVLSFLSQVPNAVDNHVDCSSLARLFGPALFGINEALPAELSGEILQWFLENWREISSDILKISSNPGVEINRRDETNADPPLNEVPSSERSRRFSRTGADSFSKLATIEDVSVADSSDLSGRNQNTAADPFTSGKRDSILPTATQDAEFDSEEYFVVRPSALGEMDSDDRPNITSSIEPPGSLSPEDSKIRALEAAFSEARTKVAELEATNEEQAAQLTQSRFALAKAQREASEARVKLQSLEFSYQRGLHGSTNTDTPGAAFEYLEEELASARLERDTAIDIIETIKDALKI
jgi:hypothetical protein